MRQNNQAAKIKILNIVLNYIHSHDWVNYDNFADTFVDNILRDFGAGSFDLEKCLVGCSPTFFSLNSITRDKFLSEEFSTRIRDAWRKAVAEQLPVLSFVDIFPELLSIPDRDVRESAANLDVPEDKIQQSLRDALREKGASPIPNRGKDSVLEVADLEHFYLEVKGNKFSFSAVVKGFRSLSTAKVNWESISHQITKAYETRPDYILLLSAKEPVDGVITRMVDYGDSVGNRHLMIFAPPFDVAKLLRWRELSDAKCAMDGLSKCPRCGCTVNSKPIKKWQYMTISSS